MERPLGQYIDRPDAFMPCCPSCGSARVTTKDEEGLQDCLACGIWFDPCLRAELTTYLADLEAVRTFESPFEQYRDRNGQECRILRELTDEERDPEVGTMYRVLFEDGFEADAWPEELHGTGQARVIRVKDLGAAMEAHRLGGLAVESMTDPDLDATCPDSYEDWAADLAGEWAFDAAHLARVALGEGGA